MDIYKLRLKLGENGLDAEGSQSQLDLGNGNTIVAPNSNLHAAWKSEIRSGPDTDSFPRIGPGPDDLALVGVRMRHFPRIVNGTASYSYLTK